MRIPSLAIVAVLLIGCNKAASQENTSAIKEFRDLQMGKDCAAFTVKTKELVRAGDRASYYRSLLSVANKTETNAAQTVYTYWWKNRDPHDEPDTMVVIRVDNRSKTIQSVDGYVVAK